MRRHNSTDYRGYPRAAGEAGEAAQARHIPESVTAAHTAWLEAEGEVAAAHTAAENARQAYDGFKKQGASALREGENPTELRQAHEDTAFALQEATQRVNAARLEAWDSLGTIDKTKLGDDMRAAAEHDLAEYREQLAALIAKAAQVRSLTYCASWWSHYPDINDANEIPHDDQALRTGATTLGDALAVNLRRTTPGHVENRGAPPTKRESSFNSRVY